MKDILVAIDFSKGSIHALEYAIELANLLKTNITLVWVDSQVIPDPGFISETNEIRDESKKNLEEIVSAYRPRLRESKMNYKIRKGKVYSELAAVAKANDSSIIITGTHGVTGFEEYWIGSNACRIVNYAPCPVISVRFNYEINRGFRRIVLPLDHTPHTSLKIPFTAALAKKLGAEINLVGVNSSSLKTIQRLISNTVVKAEKFLKNEEVNCSVHYIESANVASSVIDITKDLDADMIAIVTQNIDVASNVILGQSAMQLVNFSPVPVLSIHNR